MNVWLDVSRISCNLVCVHPLIFDPPFSVPFPSSYFFPPSFKPLFSLLIPSQSSTSFSTITVLICSYFAIPLRSPSLTPSFPFSLSLSFPMPIHFLSRSLSSSHFFPTLPVHILWSFLSVFPPRNTAI